MFEKGGTAVEVEGRRGAVLKSLPSHQKSNLLQVCDSLLAFPKCPQISLTAPSLKIPAKSLRLAEQLNGVIESNLRAITELIHIISKSLN